MIATVILVAKLIILIYAPNFIIPPRDPVAPTTVYVLDYGFHSRLVLPDRGARLIQYGYGDWQHFALQERNLITTLKALFIPTQGTLAREELINSSTIQEIAEAQARITSLTIEVANEKVVKLRNKLQDRFDRNIETKVEGNRTNVQFVKDDQDYTIFYNSNHQVADWLEELGCEVEGVLILPNFQLQENH
ncbi:DUF2459 domain-containing protein [Euhalothece natronophila Z-M001]|uniref:DUF2459 domain-containing protein n=2 Tax=Euhalothece TaxID=65097 RepID=A0A5B8NMG7_9CHRO|nr:DUF2459 domain-containing protein [Euhalothece natronophila Z-M001]